MPKLLSTKSIAGLAGAALLISTPVLAHHGWAGYGQQNFSISGKLEVAQLGNPHGVLRMVDASGKPWTITLGPALNQRRAGLTEEFLPVGASITAQGRRHINPDVLEVKTERLLVGQRAFDIYPERLAAR
jgi:hypothetical protein